MRGFRRLRRVGLLRRRTSRRSLLGNSHGGNLIGDAGALLIAEAIRATRLAKLVHLGLSYNSITDEGSHALAEALRADQERVGIVQSLQQLTITANRLTEEGGRAL